MFNTILIAHCAEHSQGHETPGLLACVRASIGHYEPTVTLPQGTVEQAIDELARMGKANLAEQLSQAAR